MTVPGDLSRRTLLVAMAAAAAGCAHGGASAPPGELRTVVLVHGAGTGSWLWDDVVAPLRDRGYAPLAPSLAGAGERAAPAGPSVGLSTHVEEIARLLEAANLRQVVLVGFSYGGLVVGDVANLAPERVQRLVFVDAFVPVPGQSLFDLMPPPVRESIETAAREEGAGWQVPPAPLALLGGVGRTSGRTEAAVLARLEGRRPWPLAAYSEPARPANPAAAALPRDYIYCNGKQGPDPLRPIAEQARRQGWGYAELPTGHFAPLTMPTELAALLATAIEGKLGR